MGKVERFEDLTCWQSARELVKFTFIACKSCPITKDFSTQDQLKRAALSIMNNIAEGFARFHNKEFVHFLNIAQSSAAEFMSMTYALQDIQYLQEETAADFRLKAHTTQKQILAFIKYLNTKTP